MSRESRAAKQTLKVTQERWFVAEAVASCEETIVVGEAAPRSTFRISDVVEVGDVQYIEEQNKLTWFSLF